MVLSEWTLLALKNFATINSGIVLMPGKFQRTISPESSILVEAELEDDFPEKFGIYDLNQFLGNVTTLKTPELKFTDKFVTMKDDLFSLSYMSCDPELITTPPNKKLVIEEPDVSFELSNSTFTKVKRIAQMNNLPNISVVGTGKELLLQVHDQTNSSQNFAKTKLGPSKRAPFTATFKIDNLKLIPDDYVVDIKLGAFARFASGTRVLNYYICVETK